MLVFRWPGLQYLGHVKIEMVLAKFKSQTCSGIGSVWFIMLRNADQKIEYWRNWRWGLLATFWAISRSESGPKQQLHVVLFCSYKFNLVLSWKPSKSLTVSFFYPHGYENSLMHISITQALIFLKMSIPFIASHQEFISYVFTIQFMRKHKTTST